MLEGGEHRLGYITEHTHNGGGGHVVPFPCLCEVTYSTYGEESSEDHSENILTYLSDDVGDQDLAAEAEHLFTGPKSILIEGRQGTRANLPMLSRPV